MDLPLIQTPLAPRWVWMEEVTYSHIPIATLITAFLVLAPIFEYIGHRKGDPRYDRLAKSLVFFTMILYSPGAALGTGIPIFIIGLWPEFWHRFANLFFWPLVIQFVFFLFDVAFLFFGYYLTWDRWQGDKKRLHIFMGVMSAFFGLLIQAVWDSLGGFMTTPSVALPMVDQPVGWSTLALFNPSFPYLFWHRFFGNISYAMLLTGGVFAIKYWRQKNPEEKAYFGFAADTTFTIGLIAFFAMPFIGWGFAKIMQANAPIVFHAVMGGHASTVWLAKMALVGLLLILSGGYLFARHRSLLVKGAIIVGIAGGYMVVSWHPPLDWLGGPMAWRVGYSLITAGILGWLWWAGRKPNPNRKAWKVTMFIAGLIAFFAFCLGGFVRESARQPYSVYDQLIKPEVTAMEADRWLTYERCIGCHFRGVNDFARAGVKDWPAVVSRERKLKRVNLTDDQARRVAGYLRERYP